MPAFEVIALDTATPQLRAPGAGDTYLVPRSAEMAAGTSFGWAGAALWSPSSNVIEQYNSTNAQTLNIYNTRTDASNYERGFVKWSGNVFQIGTEAAGTGTRRAISMPSGSRLLLGGTDLGGNALNIFTSSVGTPLIIQTNGASAGEAVVSITASNSVTGSVRGIQITGNSTSELNATVQQNGNGSAKFEFVVLGAGDAFVDFGINGGQHWAVGLDNSDSDSFKVSGSGSLGLSDYVKITTAGRIGLGGVSTPTAALHLPAGTASANTAPLKLTAGTNLTTPENGAFEFDGTNLYFTTGGARKTVTLV